MGVTVNGGVSDLWGDLSSSSSVCIDFLRHFYFMHRDCPAVDRTHSRGLIGISWSLSFILFLRWDWDFILQRLKRRTSTAYGKDLGDPCPRFDLATLRDSIFVCFVSCFLFSYGARSTPSSSKRMLFRVTLVLRLIVFLILSRLYRRIGEGQGSRIHGLLFFVVFFF